MTPPAKIIGHPLNFGPGLGGLFKKACWEIPDILGSSLMALVGMGMAAIGCYNYVENDGDNREYKSVYYVVRKSDPRSCKLNNPVYSEYTCDS